MKCTVVVARNPEGNMADDTDYTRCEVEPAEPHAPEPWGFPMCAEHRALFAADRLRTLDDEDDAP